MSPKQTDNKLFMKKIATIVTLALGFFLWTLNVGIHNKPLLLKNAGGIFSMSVEKVEVKEEEEKTLDLSQINLPSIFEALFRSL